MDMKKKPGRPKGVRNKKRKEDPREVAVVDKLLNEPKTMPIREHPYILFLAKKWEAIEEQIEKLTKFGIHSVEDKPPNLKSLVKMQKNMVFK